MPRLLGGRSEGAGSWVVSGKTGVLIVEPHPVTRTGLECVLQREPSIDVLGAAGTAADALEQCARLHPLIAIMDVVLPDGSGVDLCRTIKRSYPQTRVLILSDVDDDATVFGAIGAGASGYILKDISPDGLVQALYALRNGQAMLHPGVARRMLDQFSRLDGRGQPHNGRLTSRETEILVEVAKAQRTRKLRGGSTSRRAPSRAASEASSSAWTCTIAPKPRPTPFAKDTCGRRERPVHRSGRAASTPPRLGPPFPACCPGSSGSPRSAIRASRMAER
jgi:DNA-binding NarL/FixJ family response regulator